MALSKSSNWTVRFSSTAEKALSKLDQQAQIRILKYIRQRLDNTPEDPRRYGEALTGSLSGLWRYRIGTFRLICEIKDEEVLIWVLTLGHRKEIYR